MAAILADLRGLVRSLDPVVDLQARPMLYKLRLVYFDFFWRIV